MSGNERPSPRYGSMRADIAVITVEVVVIVGIFAWLAGWL